jgi:hypothetical protein
VLFQPFYAEKLRTNWFFWLGENRRRRLGGTRHVLAILILRKRGARRSILTMYAKIEIVI